MDNIDSPSLISLNIKYSKTDQSRIGIRVVLGKTGDDLCPVSVLLQYLSRRGSKAGALFQWENRTPLSKIKFVEATRQALSAAHLPAKDYAGHSFRIGAATTAAMSGLEDSTIQTLGRWKSSSYQLYIQANPRQLASTIECTPVDKPVISLYCLVNYRTYSYRVSKGMCTRV